jgi:pyrophosphate--fructose-6-phosphate 1-phosphotransferase
MTVRKVAILTAGGLAPCLSSAIGGLIERYSEVAPDVEIIGYKDGYKGLLLGDSTTITPEGRRKAHLLHRYGGSPLGNSRVKLTNVQDCIDRGLCEPDELPLERAAEQLTRDKVDVLHTIGGDDTNTTAADLAAHLAENDYELRVVGLPKTIDNDVYPIKQSLGAYTAAEMGARYASNIISEHSSNPRMLIVHEVMGRHCGWLTAATAAYYRRWLDRSEFAPELGLDRDRWEVHGVFVPEMEFDLQAESERLRAVMDDVGAVNLFISEGAGMDTIISEIESRGEEVQRDAFGHVKLDTINPGAWFGKQFAEMLGAEKVMIQKSGYYSRSAPSNSDDLRLIQSCTTYAVEASLRGESGVVGHDEDQKNTLRAIEFPRIAGGKPFNIDNETFDKTLAEIGQTKGAKVDTSH